MKNEDLKFLQTYATKWKEFKELKKELDEMNPQLERLFAEKEITHFNYLGIIWSYVGETVVPEHLVNQFTRKAYVSLRK